VFDRDSPQVVKEVSGEDKPFKHWGNNVYSFAIPLPSHRLHYENVSIEFYYSDAEIKTHDTEGRRLEGNRDGSIFPALTPEVCKK
jgi:hypothetical protein